MKCPVIQSAFLSLCQILVNTYRKCWRFCLKKNTVLFCFVLFLNYLEREKYFSKCTNGHFMWLWSHSLFGKERWADLLFIKYIAQAGSLSLYPEISVFDTLYSWAYKHLEQSLWFHSILLTSNHYLDIAVTLT